MACRHSFGAVSVFGLECPGPVWIWHHASLVLHLSSFQGPRSHCIPGFGTQHILVTTLTIISGNPPAATRVSPPPPDFFFFLDGNTHDVHYEPNALPVPLRIYSQNFILFSSLRHYGMYSISLVTSILRLMANDKHYICTAMRREDQGVSLPRGLGKIRGKSDWPPVGEKWGTW